MEANKNRCVPHLSQNYFWTCPILTICAYQREDHRGSGLVISDATLARTVLVLLLSVFLKTRFLVLAKITSTNFVFLERSLLCVDLRNHFISKMSQSKLESPHWMTSRKVFLQILMLNFKVRIISNKSTATSANRKLKCL